MINVENDYSIMMMNDVITEELRQTLLTVSFRVLSFADFVKAIDQNILLLTEEFVTRVVLGSVHLFIDVLFILCFFSRIG